MYRKVVSTSAGESNAVLCRSRKNWELQKQASINPVMIV